MTQLPNEFHGYPLITKTAHVLCLADETQDSVDVVGYVGGEAMLPGGFEMPSMTTDEGTEVLSHVATISTQVLRHLAPGIADGHLVFLFATQTQPWGFIGTNSEEYRVRDTIETRDGHRVIFVPAGAACEPAQSGQIYPRAPLVLKKEEIVDLEDGDAIFEMDDTIFDEFCALLDGIDEEAFAGKGAINLSEEVDFVQNDFFSNLPGLAADVYGYEGTTAKDWVCIAQLYSVNNVLEHSPAYGDGGMIYYCITREDLAAMRFDRTLCQLQCG